MRFNNRACALMEIPDLPQNAFEHCGDGKIKPQGGGGGDIISAVTDPISDVLGTSGDGGGILGAVEDVGQAVGDVGASFEKEVIDPLGGYKVVAPIAAAVAAPYLIPELAALATPEAAFAGATETGLATLAGEGALADTVGATLLSGATEAAATEAIGQALPYTVAADAANLAANGYDAATIAQNLTATGVDSFVAADAANLAAQGLSEAAIAQNIAQGYTATELGGTGLTSTLPSLSKPFISPGQALQLGRLGMGLLGGGGQRQQQQIPQMGQARTRLPQGNVDYGGIYNLLALQRARNPNSLLG
jgi:hypothetical protein